MKTEPAIGWGLKVYGPNPYIGFHFSLSKIDIDAFVTKPYHRAVKVAIVPLREWNRLKRIERRGK